MGRNKTILMLNDKTTFKILFAAFCFILYGCESQTDVPEPAGSGKISIAYLKSLYERMPVAIEKDIYILGRVVSSDSHGNFYKTLIIEDSTGGIAVRIDLENYYKKYDKGSLARVNCNSLVLSDYGGTLQFGTHSYPDAVQNIGYIPANRLDAVISVDRSKDQEVIPPETTIAALTPNHISRTVKFTHVQFVDEELGLAWTEDSSDTDRHIIDNNGDRLIVRTSAYALFATWLLPRQSGSIQGVISYFNGEYQLILCDLESVMMKDERF